MSSWPDYLKSRCFRQYNLRKDPPKRPRKRPKPPILVIPKVEICPITIVE